MRQYALAVVLAVAVLFSSWLVVAQFAQTSPQATQRGVVVRASAVGVSVSGPGVKGRRVVVAEPISGSRAATSASAPGFRYPASGSLVTVSQLSSTATAQQTAGTAAEQVSVAAVEFAGGVVRIEGASLRASAAVSGSMATARVVLAPGAHLAVNGKEQALLPNTRIDIPNIGTLVVNEQAFVDPAPKGDAVTGPRHHAVGAIAHLTLTSSHDGLPAGSEIVVGRVDGSVVKPLAPKQVAQIVSPMSANVTTGPDSSLPRKAATIRVQAPPPTGSLQGYVLPVVGMTKADDPDSFGAARADTGSHAGNDIFAPEGTPIVAVADGTLNRVGWNSIGGWRFWLEDSHGNAFYHAHLSAYAPGARDGLQVHAGDVIGFVGHTGDAQGTPDHLHFEIHPAPGSQVGAGLRRNGSAIDPHPFLMAWLSGTTVPGTGLSAGVGGVAPLTLLSAVDISTVSGLAPGRLMDALPAGEDASANEPAF